MITTARRSLAAAACAAASAYAVSTLTSCHASTCGDPAVGVQPPVGSKLASSSSCFNTQPYWDERFQRMINAGKHREEWGSTFDDLKDLFKRHVDPKSRVLHVGAGLSDLPHQMRVHGHIGPQTCIDYSEAAVQLNQARERAFIRSSSDLSTSSSSPPSPPPAMDPSSPPPPSSSSPFPPSSSSPPPSSLVSPPPHLPPITHLHGDARQLHGLFPVNGCFDVVIDKGLMDANMEVTDLYGVETDMDGVMGEMHRLLKPGGVALVVLLGPPAPREAYFRGGGAVGNWRVGAVEKVGASIDDDVVVVGGASTKRGGGRSSSSGGGEYFCYKLIAVK